MNSGTATRPLPRWYSLVLAGTAVMALAGLALFVLGCWSAAADAQGAIMLFLIVPVLLISTVPPMMLSWRARSSRSGRLILYPSFAIGAFYFLFYLAAVVPPFRFFSDGVIHGVAVGYKAFTGMSPYEADQLESKARTR